MPTLSKPELLSRIDDAIRAAGWSVLHVSTASSRHPFDLGVYQADQSLSVRIYVWNVTHGGGEKRPKDEYRIQLKGTKLEPRKGFESLLLGWWEEQQVFIGWDFTMHSGALGKSPSVQVRGETVRNAILNGIAFQDRGNREIVVAFRPELFVEYIRYLNELHQFGESAGELDILNRAAHPDAKVEQEELETVAEPRRVIVQVVNRRVRDSNFKRRVLTAYNNQCAFCGLQLNLVDAAHILPVASGGSTDETRNGLSMCPLHHRAYDAGLITIDEDYQVVTSGSRLDKLRGQGLDGGMDKFLEDLRTMIHVPPDGRDRPFKTYVKRANKLRGWETDTE
ncbi:MAG: HNH endonuclease [Chloroflexota bacterium]|nr:HNH endonuclease [Chloroflexota bacterium]MDQ5864695.1 HNH endonuclease [Chloroflexota bacterium]